MFNFINCTSLHLNSLLWLNVCFEELEIDFVWFSLDLYVWGSPHYARKKKNTVGSFNFFWGTDFGNIFDSTNDSKHDYILNQTILSSISKWNSLKVSMNV